MLFRTQSAAVYGIDADLVDIEVDLTPARGEADANPSVTIVGLPDAAVRESRERIRAAVNNSGFFFPFHKTTINLAPADVRKEGASFDLPIALGILGANGDLGDAEGLTDVLSLGELSLDGRVRPVRGALPVALRAREAGIKSLLLPEENATEAAVVSGVDVYAVPDPARRGRAGCGAARGQRARAAATGRSASCSRPTSPTTWTSARCAGSSPSSARSKLPPRGHIIFCLSARRARGRRCSRSVCRPSCRRWSSRRRLS